MSNPDTQGVHPKGQAAGWAGAASIVLVWILGMLDVTVPPEVASAITVLLSASAFWFKSA